MLSTNEINKIKINGQLRITNVNMTTLMFNNGLLKSKLSYSIVDNYINVLDPIEKSLCLYKNTNSAEYFEYSISLKNSDTVITGNDKFNNSLKGMSTKTVLVFVNGYKLLPTEFTINNDNSLTILHKYPSEDVSTVVIYSSDNIVYMGQPITNGTWNDLTRSFELPGYVFSRYSFFINGQLIPYPKISFTGDKVTLNIPIRPGIDIIEYYRFPIDTISLYFEEAPGHFSYGPKDDFGTKITNLYDVIATFSNHIARLAVDNIRPGFFIKEENGEGCLMIVNDDFETHDVQCISISPFSKYVYDNTQFFLQVPEARSILKYVSEFDLKGSLFPELLGIFQRLLLDETYDSLQRLKNIRSINKVDSTNINALINFLGLNLNITNMSLEEKHALLEELNNFHKIVGTKTSYNFYNVTSSASRIMKLEQLFTPIKDLSDDVNDPIQRYVTFRTAEELGAIYKRKYVYNVTDYGEVDTLANPTDSFTNTPNFAGKLLNPKKPAILNDTRVVYINDTNGNTVPTVITITPNKYIDEPEPGPNKPTIDYGDVGNPDITNSYDYGYVYEEIIGKWIEWFEWDRPTNWYPTNHVNISVEIPVEIDYNTFMNEFKNTFYNIASTVLYIHSVIQVYTFGQETLWEKGMEAHFGIMSTPNYYEIEYTFTNDPARQAVILSPL